MRKIKLFAVALGALSLFSCSKENTTKDLGVGEQANVTIKLVGSGNAQTQRAATRAIGDGTAQDAKINNYTVLLFRADDKLDSKLHFQADGSTADVTASTLATKVYVIANTGSSALFDGVKSVDELKAVTGSLMDGTAPGSISTQTATNLWMVGEGPVTMTGNTGSAMVQLDFMAAKINVIVKDNRTRMTGGAIEITDDAVVLLYAGAQAKFFGTDTEKTTQTKFFTADNSYWPLLTSAPTDVTLENALSDAVGTKFTTNTPGAVSNHFYTFGNDGASKPTILAIKSTKTINGVASTVYYPVQFTITDAGHTIKPGAKYDVTFTLNGDVAAGGGGGTINPDVELKKAMIKVEVKEALWKPETVTKEFN